MSQMISVVSDEEYSRMSLEQKANAMTFKQRQADIERAEKEEAESREREKRSPYDKFAQVNLDHDVCLARRKLVRDSPCAMVIWEFLMEQADRKNAVICSQTLLAEVLGYEKATVSKAMKILRERNFVGVVKSGNSTVYWLNKRIFWKSYGTNYKYGKFEAVVLVGEDEQDKAELEKPIIMNRTPAIEVRKRRKKDSQPTRKDSQQTGEDEWNDTPSWENEEPPEE